MGLQIPDTMPLFAAGASDHLIEQLERPLRSARIAVAEPKVGIDELQVDYEYVRL